MADELEEMTQANWWKFLTMQSGHKTIFMFGGYRLSIAFKFMRRIAQESVVAGSTCSPMNTIARRQTPGGQLTFDGPTAIDGVPGTSAPWLVSSPH